MAPQTDRILYVDFAPQAKRQTPLKPKLRIVAPATSEGLAVKRSRFANPGQNPALNNALQNFRRRLSETELALSEVTHDLEGLQSRLKTIKTEMKASSARAKAIATPRGGTVSVMRPVSGKHGGKKSWQVLGNVREAIREAKSEKQRLTKQKFDLSRDITFLEAQRELQFQHYIDSLVNSQQPVAGVEPGLVAGMEDTDESRMNMKAIV